MSAIVNTFIVGMPTGTTSLHRYLSEHPDTCMAEDKEPHFFSVDLLNEEQSFMVIPDIRATQLLNLTTNYSLKMGMLLWWESLRCSICSPSKQLLK